MINMDMVGRLRPVHERMWPEILGMLAAQGGSGIPGLIPLSILGEDSQKDWSSIKHRLIVQGAFTARNFDSLLNDVNKKYDFKITKQPGGLGPSDHASFYAKKIPVYFLFTGDHADYHRPSDTSDKINVPGMKRIADMVEDLTDHVARLPERPVYVKTVAPFVPRTEGPIPRLGIRPSYGDSGQGVLLGAVNEDGPAAKAGLKEGDRIVEMGGKTIKDLNAYMAIIAKHRKGDSLELGVLREGKLMTVKVTPE
jgi:PDZ domain/Peptidase family M28